MSGLRRYGFRDGGSLPALRPADGEAVSQMRKHKHSADIRIEKGRKRVYVRDLRSQYDQK